MNANCFQGYSLNDLAELSGLSYGYINKVFYKVTGMEKHYIGKGTKDDPYTLTTYGAYLVFLHICENYNKHSVRGKAWVGREAILGKAAGKVNQRNNLSDELKRLEEEGRHWKASIKSSSEDKYDQLLEIVEGNMENIDRIIELLEKQNKRKWWQIWK